MPTAPLKYCAQQGCPEKVSGSRCEGHTAQARHRQQRYTAGNYGRPHRRRIATFRALYPDRIWCEECLSEGTDTPVEEYDHVIPHRGDKRLRDDVSNLQPLCKRHHSMKTAREVLTPAREVLIHPDTGGSV